MEAAQVLFNLYVETSEGLRKKNLQIFQSHMMKTRKLFRCLNCGTLGKYNSVNEFSKIAKKLITTKGE